MAGKIRESWADVQKTKQDKTDAKVNEKTKQKKVSSMRLSLIIEAIVVIVVFGATINFSLWALFDLRFTYFSWIGWGFIYYIMVDELLIQNLWLRPRQ